MFESIENKPTQEKQQEKKKKELYLIVKAYYRVAQAIDNDKFQNEKQAKRAGMNLTNLKKKLEERGVDKKKREKLYEEIKKQEDK